MSSNATILLHARRSLYLLSPKEASYRDIRDVPKYVDEAIPFMFCVVAIEYLFMMWHGHDTARINDAISSVTSGGFERIIRIIISTGELAIYTWVYQHFRIFELNWRSASTWWLGFLGVDFGYYWFHRALHEIHVLWTFHQVHHSSEDYNLTTAMRKSVFQFYFQWIFYVPMAIAVPPAIFFVHLQLNLLYQFWIHTELIGSLGPLDLILNTPSHHRVHHGGTLIIWDRLFGTFQAESEEKVCYGLVTSVNSWNPLYIQFFLCHKLWNKVRCTKGWKNKLSVVFKGPSWTPGSPWCGNKQDKPEIKYPVVKYDETMSRKRMCYCMIHLLLFLISYKQLILKEQTLGYPWIVGFFLYFVLTATSVGALFESKWYSSGLEFMRCMLFIVMDLVLNAHDQDIPIIPSRYISMIRGFYILSAFTWMFVAWNDFNASLKQTE